VSENFELNRAIDLWSITRELDDTAVLLDNPGAPARLGSWAYLGLFPIDEVVVPRGGIASDALERLAAMLEPAAAVPGSPPLTSGVLGYLAYELLHEIEPVPRSAAPAPVGPLMHFTRFAAVLAVDASAGRTVITARDEKSLATARELAESAPDRIEIPQPPRSAAAFGLDELIAAGLTPHTGATEYRALVDAARESIAAGRVFEVCLTQEFTATADIEGHKLYEELRRRNPAPMSAYLRGDGVEVLCSSPERLVSVSSYGTIETRPIKGTRPRSADPKEDARLREELANSAKDRAENTMIVDLARNDLGRVCETGSVEVPELCVLESYASVHHLVSTVRGTLRDGVGPTDVIRACFPAGSMTGAPKVEAMKMIAEVEHSQRGIFSGAIGWIGDDGAMDLNVVIRTIIKRGDQLSFHTGGAVTSESTPDAEYAETMDKARVLAESIAAVQRRTVKA
jgi:aminodeoxychorismate synthase component I